VTEPDPSRLEEATGPQAVRQVYRASRNPSAKEQREYLRRHREQLAVERRRRLRQTPSGLLATRGARRRLAAVAGVPFLSGLGAAISRSLPDDDSGVLLMTSGLLTLVMLLSFAVGWPLLRRATGDLADMSESLLDEPDLREKGQVATQAYTVMVAVVATCVVLAFADGLLANWTLAAGGWLTFLTGLLISGIMLPSGVTAWRWTGADG